MKDIVFCKGDGTADLHAIGQDCAIIGEIRDPEGKAVIVL